MIKRVGGSWSPVATAAVLVLMLVAPASASAKAHAGLLDKSFGKGGKVTIAFPSENAGGLGVKYEVPFQFTPGHLQMATAPGGKVVVASSTEIVRLLPNGKRDPSFGSGGTVAVERPAGQTFLLADVAVDSTGRVVIAGSVRPLPTESTPDPLLSMAMVRRYGADGSPDASFGSQGTVITDFGLLPPQIGNDRYKGASVGLRSLVVDRENRLILTGGSVSEVIRCYEREDAVSAGFVARLTESGAPDPSFGDDGLRQIADFGSFAQGHLFPNGDLFSVASPKFSCSGNSGPRVVLTSFDASGNLAPGFGFSGFRSVGFRSAPVAALAPSGKILLLGAKQNAGKHEARQLIMRLLVDGAIDPGFGRIGRINLLIPRSAGFAAITADGKERLLVAGHVSHKLPRPGPRRATFALVRIKPKGSIDRSFGRRGSAITGFGGPSDSYATQVLVRGGRILVGGIVSTPRLPTGGGYAIARFVGGR